MVWSNDPDRFLRGKDIGSSIDWIALLMSGTWIVFIRARIMAARNSLFFWRLD